MKAVKRKAGSRVRVPVRLYFTVYGIIPRPPPILIYSIQFSVSSPPTRHVAHVRFTKYTGVTFRLNNN
jgi:hypothetical protein